MLHRLKLGLSIVLLLSSSACLHAMNYKINDLDFSITETDPELRLGKYHWNSLVLNGYDARHNGTHKTHYEKTFLTQYMKDLEREQQTFAGPNLEAQYKRLRTIFDTRLKAIKDAEMRERAGDLTIVETRDNLESTQKFVNSVFKCVETVEYPSDEHIRMVTSFVTSAESIVARLTLRQAGKLATDEELTLLQPYTDLCTKSETMLQKLNARRAGDLSYQGDQVQKMLNVYRNNSKKDDQKD